MIVIDTSVVLKWFVAEEDSDCAIELIGQQLLAPDLIAAELGNALWKKWRKGEIVADQAQKALQVLPEMVGMMPSLTLAEAAMDIAMTCSHPIYDCYFLALAETCDARLVTADERFLGKLAGSRFARRGVSMTEYQS